MKLTVLQPPKAGDRRVLTEQDLDKLHEEGCYDSYSRLYEIQGLNWVVINKICRANGTTEYTLECQSEE
jgi:hypothetical protein